MVEFRTIPLADIIVPERLRMVEEDYALAIQASIVEHGLINPVTVRKTPPATKPFKPFTLVVGAHRLRAIELLDVEEIEAIVVTADADEAQLVEITENLFRNELSALDRAMFVLSYREIWERKHGKIDPKGGRPKNSVNITELMSDEAKAGFSVHVAGRLGLSVNAIEKAQQIGRNLAPDLRRCLRGTASADNQSLLLKLAKLEPQRQHKIALAFADSGDIQGALDLSNPNAQAAASKSAQQEILDRLTATWARADEKSRAAFLDHIGATVAVARS